MDLNENESIWEEVYNEWEDICSYQFPELSKGIKYEKILVKSSWTKFVKYDWVSNDKYEYFLNNPVIFMNCGSSMNNGALQTLENLINAKNDPELLGAIWIYAFTKYLLHELRRSEVSDKHVIIRINKSAEIFLKKRGFFWNTLMKVLLPEMCISNSLIKDLETINHSIVLELNALCISYILAKYSVLEYNSEFLERQ